MSTSDVMGIGHIMNEKKKRKNDWHIIVVLSSSVVVFDDPLFRLVYVNEI